MQQEKHWFLAAYLCLNSQQSLEILLELILPKKNSSEPTF